MIKKRKATLFWAAHSNQPSKNIMLLTRRHVQYLLSMLLMIVLISVNPYELVINNSKVDRS